MPSPPSPVSFVVLPRKAATERVLTPLKDDDEDEIGPPIAQTISSMTSPSRRTKSLPTLWPLYLSSL
jgi:hypothetical protein